MTYHKLKQSFEKSGTQLNKIRDKVLPTYTPLVFNSSQLIFLSYKPRSIVIVALPMRNAKNFAVTCLK